ncbi:MAG: B12-binding domain-containing radical SAM protein [Bacteroidetes bacterium]|nr:B12-binding domain-containing radical SAM protein [Bacteroidota bacterium]
MKVLLVAPHAKLIGYSRLFNQTDDINLGLLSIEAACRQKGHETRVVLLSEENTESIIKEFNPDVVGITSLTPTYCTALSIGKRIKKIDPGIITVYGGHHVSALPEETLADEAVDYVVRGEGEEAFPMLLEALQHGEKTPDIEGVCYSLEGRAMHTETKAVVQDLDALPFMVQDILNNERVFIVSSRGCPFKCDFCSVGSFYDRQWRKRSVESIISELEFNEKKRKSIGKKLTLVDFRDDNLTVDSTRLYQLCEGIKDKGWEFTWHCQSRVDTLVKHPLLLNKMTDSGCSIMALGLESGLQEILDSYKKGISFEQSVKAASLLASQKVLHIWYAMLGSGNDLDTPELLKKNIEAIAAFPFDLLQVSLLTPFPGTPLYNRLSAEGRLLHRNWDLYDGLHCVYQPKGIDPADMEKAFLWAYRKIFIQSGIRRIIRTIRCSRPFWGNTINPLSLLRIVRDMVVLKKDIF